MNRDLKEKGLRHCRAGCPSSSWAMNRDLKEKGLRLPTSYRFITCLNYEPRPEREGIKTDPDSLTNRRDLYEPRPEREGIKTLL